MTRPTLALASLNWVATTAWTSPWSTSVSRLRALTSAPARSTTRRGGSESLKTVNVGALSPWTRIAVRDP